MDELLLQLIRAYRGPPHSATEETANVVMFDRERRLPDQLQAHPPAREWENSYGYVLRSKNRLEEAHEELRQQQLKILYEDQEEPIGCWRDGMVIKRMTKEE